MGDCRRVGCQMMQMRRVRSGLQVGVSLGWVSFLLLGFRFARFNLCIYKYRELKKLTESVRSEIVKVVEK
jgi:hypothetical protein